jgi:hypothetical protein
MISISALPDAVAGANFAFENFDSSLSGNEKLYTAKKSILKGDLQYEKIPLEGFFQGGWIAGHFCGGSSCCFLEKSSRQPM